MFDLSWGEVMVIGAVALIVIGPKDLPKALRTLGNMTSKVRRMAGEFRSQFDDAMREAELDEIRKQVEGVNQSVGPLNESFNPIQTVRDELKGAIEGPARNPARERALATDYDRGSIDPVPIDAGLPEALPAPPPEPSLPAEAGPVEPPPAPPPSTEAGAALPGADKPREAGA
jgi:sec-independent protein translocase protein TatB